MASLKTLIERAQRALRKQQETTSAGFEGWYLFQPSDSGVFDFEDGGPGEPAEFRSGAIDAQS